MRTHRENWQEIYREMRETFRALAREKKALEAQGVAPAQQGDIAKARIREKNRLQRLARGIPPDSSLSWSDDLKEQQEFKETALRGDYEYP